MRLSSPLRTIPLLLLVNMLGLVHVACSAAREGTDGAGASANQAVEGGPERAAGSSSAVGPTPMPYFRCDEGDILQYTLKQLDAAPSVAETRQALRDLKVTTAPQVVHDEGQYKLLLSLCMDVRGTLTSARIDLRWPNLSEFQSGYRPTTVSELEAALGGEAATVLFESDSGDPNSGLALRSAKDSRGNSVVYVVRVSAAQGSDGRTVLGVDDPRVMVGTLVEGNPFSTERCGVREKPIDKTWTAGTATIVLQGCTWTAFGTMQFNITKAQIDDTNTAVPADKRSVVLTGQALEQATKVKVGHHNICSALSLQLPHAAYGATTPAAVAGPVGGSPCPSFFEAPARNANEGAEALKVRISYGPGREWIGYAEHQWHFLLTER